MSWLCETRVQEEILFLEVILLVQTIDDDLDSSGGGRDMDRLDIYVSKALLSSID